MKGMKQTEEEGKKMKVYSLLMIVFIVHFAFHIECIPFQSDQIFYSGLFPHTHVPSRRKEKQ